jgi:hypothetical protein
MIAKKVVLVLGAGASMPFGFPSGVDLKAVITERLVRGDPWHSVLISDFGSTHTGDFRTALLKSGKQSVDAFLEHRTTFLEVGKAAIACALLPCEVEDSLFIKRKESWYDYLFKKCNSQFEQFSDNSVSVLTFNYDRSLEHYLFTTLKNSYGKTSEECAGVLRSLPIIHLHGQLGELPWSNNGQINDRVPFGADVSRASSYLAAKAIKIIHEDIAGNEQFQQAQKLLQEANLICCIGFGYDDTNMQRLFDFAPNQDQIVVGSAKGLSERECSIISDKLRRFGFTAKITLENVWGEALDFLHVHCPFD